ncbi:asparaginase [Rhizobacter fulvus]
MQNVSSIVVVLGTGGTIAGAASEATDNVGYVAAQRGVAQLLAAVPALAGAPIEAEQIAQLDSKDMTHAVWHALALRCAHHLARPEVAGIVITHGTDTLEETAWFLQRTLAPARPIVLAAAMRPATALQADGPQNLLDAVTVARTPGARGVTALLAGRLHAAADVRKVHPYRLDAFASGDAGPLGVVEEGVLGRFREWPCEPALVGAAQLPADAGAWPAVEIVTSHAGASGEIVAALCAAGTRGIVVAATGNGSVHERLERALAAAQDAGVSVWRSTRCLDGRIIDSGDTAFPSAGALTPTKARIELMLRLMAASAAAQAARSS